MEFLKKQKFGFWAECLVFVLAIVCLGIYVANVNMPYYMDMNPLVLYLMAGALVTLGASLMLSQMGDSKIIFLLADICRIAATALIIVAGGNFIGMRVESFGYIFGSNLELGNDAAFAAGNQAILGIVIFVITWVLAVIASFFDVKKKAA